MAEISRARSLPKKLAPSLHEHVHNFRIRRTWAELIASLATHELQEKAAAHCFCSRRIARRNETPSSGTSTRLIQRPSVSGA